MTTKTILIADDDNDLVQSLALRLKRLGVSVLRTPDASHAFFGALRAVPDLIVLDVNMPNGNGLALCEMLAGSESCCHTPVIIHTGLSNAATITRCAQLGAQYVCKSPGSPERIVQLVSDFLNGNESRLSNDATSNPALAATRNSAPVPDSSPDSAPSMADPAPAATPAKTPTVLSKSEWTSLNSMADRQHLTRRPRILTIDDDHDVSRSLQLQLEPLGVEVLPAFNGEEGYRVAIEKKPDLIITDLVLPEAEGAYIIRKIRSNPELADIPIFVLTGQSYPALRHQIMSLGVDAFLTKPLAARQLLKELQGYIDLRNIPSHTSAAVHCFIGNGTAVN